MRWHLIKWNSTHTHFKPRLQSLDRVLRLCAICILGLLHTVYGNAARFLAGLFLADLEFRERVVQFYFQQLAYDRDLLSHVSSVLRHNWVLCPFDVLRQERDQFQISDHASQFVL